MQNDSELALKELSTPAEKHDSSFVVKIPFSEITNGYGVETQCVQPRFLVLWIRDSQGVETIKIAEPLDRRISRTLAVNLP